MSVSALLNNDIMLQGGLDAKQKTRGIKLVTV